MVWFTGLLIVTIQVGIGLILKVRCDLSSIIFQFFFLCNMKISILQFQNYIFMLYDIFFRFENIVSIEIYDFIDKHSIAFCMLFKEKFKILKPQNSMVMHAKCLGINRHKWKWRRNNSLRKIIEIWRTSRVSLSDK